MKAMTTFLTLLGVLTLAVFVTACDWDERPGPVREPQPTITTTGSAEQPGLDADVLVGRSCPQLGQTVRNTNDTLLTCKRTADGSWRWTRS